MPDSRRTTIAAGIRVAACVALATVLAVSGATATADPPSDEFGEAVAAYREGRIDEAIERIRRVLDHDRDDPDALWNLGLWTAEAARHDEALEVWRRYREVAPGDWKARPKLVQEYQALERNDDRDREREELRALRDSGEIASLADAVVFCRDQFAVGGRPVFAMEWFDPSGPRPVLLEFRVIGGDGRSEAAYVLASWDDHNPVTWDDAPDSRAHRTYQLARTGRGGRETIAWYQGEPDYEKVRLHVRKDLEARD